MRPDGRTGVYFISYGEEGHVFSYARAGSAASLVADGRTAARRRSPRRGCCMRPGISQAISESCADAVFAAIRHAKANGTVVSYDTNLRLRLWPLDRARAVIHAAVALSDIALPGLDDARQLTGLDRPEEICAFYLGLGCRIVALTMGKAGTMVATAERLEVIPARPVEAVDATGAGDTFDGAFLAEWLVARRPVPGGRLRQRGGGALDPRAGRGRADAAARGRSRPSCKA